jgi:hypothetical protein
MTTSTLRIPTVVIQDTLFSLQEAGRRRSEGVVLWLGTRTDTDTRVVEAYVPEQEAARDYFRIHPKAMSELVTHLGATGTFVAAQVHSHPREAFHSLADDEWAIVRHLGALSLVLPLFAAHTTVANFLKHVAIFSLNSENEWLEVLEPERSSCLRIQ